MKKFLFLSLIFVALTATSCRITSLTASYQDPKSIINTATVADLDVSNERITYTFKASALALNVYVIRSFETSKSATVAVFIIDFGS